MSYQIDSNENIFTLAELSDAGVKVEDVSKDIIDIMPEETAFLNLLISKGLKERSVNQARGFKMFGVQDQKRTHTIGTFSAGDKEITISGGTAFENVIIGDQICMIDSTTAENLTPRNVVAVSYDGTDTTIEINALWSDGNPSAGETIYKLTHGAEEISEARKPISTIPINATQDMGFFRSTIGKGIIAGMSGQYTNTWSIQKNLLGLNFKRDIEARLLLSTLSQTLTGPNGSPIYDPLGLFYAMQNDLITSNMRDSQLGISVNAQYQAFADSVTFDDLESFTRKLSIGSKEKYWFVDKLMYGQLSKFIFNKGVPTEFVKEMEINMVSIQIGKVTLKVVCLDLLDRLNYKGGFVVDFANVRPVRYKDWTKTVVKPVLLANNKWSEEEELFTSYSLDMFNAETFGWYTHTIDA